MPPDAEPKHDDIKNSRETPGQNPLMGGLRFLLSVPEEIEIRMVDASTLSDYEVWFFLASIAASAFVGFLVPAITTKLDDPVFKPLCLMTVFLFVIFGVFVRMAFVKRRFLKKKAKILKCLVSEVSEIREKS